MSFRIALGATARKSPFFERTVAEGVSHFTIYNHMFMPVSYGDSQAEYRRLPLDTPYSALGTVLNFSGDAGGYTGQVVALPLVPPGTPLP